MLRFQNRICHLDVNDLKIVLGKNDYLLNIIGSDIKAFLYILYMPKVIIHNVPEICIFSKLTFLSITSLQIQKKLLKSHTKKLEILIL